MFERLEKIFRKNKRPESITSTNELLGMQIALLATDGFEQSELFGPKYALENAGASVHIISLRPGRIRGWKEQNWGKSITVDMTVSEAWSVEFDCLVLPGGVINPDRIRGNSEAVAFVMSFMNKKLPIAAICHGPQILIETGALKGRRMTSWSSIKTDLINAGVEWIDEAVVIDNNLITSRGPQDIPAFNKALLHEFEKQMQYSGLPNTEGFVVTL
jgi:protease I